MNGAAFLRNIGWRLSPMLRRFPRLNAAAWNAQYKLGIWNYLDTSDGAILSLVEEYSSKALILDLGCGTTAGLPLVPGRFKHYHGVDVSHVAIKEAQTLSRPDTSFEIADIFTYQPDREYDAILFREVLYYFSTDEAVQLLRRLAKYLETDGNIFVQVWRDGTPPDSTPNQFAEVIRNSGLALKAERVRGNSDGLFFVLGRPKETECLN